MSQELAAVSGQESATTHFSSFLTFDTGLQWRGRVYTSTHTHMNQPRTRWTGPITAKGMTFPACYSFTYLHTHPLGREVDGLEIL